MKRIAVLFLIFFIYSLLQAQGPPNPGPVDGGLGFLIAAGIVYGIIKLRKHEKD